MLTKLVSQKILCVFLLVLLFIIPISAQEDSDEGSILVRVPILKSNLAEMETFQIVELPTSNQGSLQVSLRGDDYVAIAGLEGAFLYNTGDLLALEDPTAAETAHQFDSNFVGVADIALSPDSDRALLAMDDGRVLLWDTTNGEIVTTYEGHTGKVWTVAYKPFNGNLFATGGDDGVVRVWEDGAEKFVLEGHDNIVTTIAFSPVIQIVASGGIDNNIRIWNTTRGEEEMVLEGHVGDVWKIAFSPDGTLLASGGGDNVIIIWDVETGEQLNLLRGHAARITSLAFNEDASLLFSGSEDLTIRVWDVESGEMLDTLELSFNSSQVNDIAFSDDKTTLVTVSVEESPNGGYFAPLVRFWGVLREGVCEIQGNNVNLRSGPGTSFDAEGQLAAGDTVIGIAQTQGADGFTWWQLGDETWIRADVAQESEDCMQLPIVEFE